MALGEKDLLEILELLERSAWDDLQLATPTFKLTISKRGRPPEAGASAPPAWTEPGADAAAVAPPDAPAAAQPTRGNGAPPAGGVVVASPTLGNFYVAPKPGEPPFVTVGQRVGPEDTVAVVEVMKLMNPVPAGIAGTIVEVRARNGDLVEYGEALFWIAPADRVERP